jgi:hypothetical protein
MRPFYIFLCLNLFNIFIGNSTFAGNAKNHSLRPGQILIPIENKSSEKKSDVLTRNPISKETQIPDPVNIDKYDNKWWRAGGTFFYIGLFTILGIAGLASITKGKGAFYVWGLIIGAAFMVISFPLLLIGKIIGKRSEQ